MAEDECGVCRRVTLAVGRPPMVREACPECGELVCDECRIPFWGENYKWICETCASERYAEEDYV